MAANQAPHPWDSPGKNTGVGCHFLLQCMKVKSESEVAQSCPTLCDPIDGSQPGSPSLGFSRQEYWSGLSFPSPMHESEKWKWSCSAVSNSLTPRTAAYQTPPPMGFSRHEYWSGVTLPSLEFNANVHWMSLRRYSKCISQTYLTTVFLFFSYKTSCRNRTPYNSLA